MTGEVRNTPETDQKNPSPSESAENVSGRIAPWINAINSDLAEEIVKLRYEHILKGIQSVNENVFKFLAIYQTLISALTAGLVLLFINHEHWSISPSTTRIGLIGILVLETIVAVFTVLMIAVGAWSWVDYRMEECEITDAVLGGGFRRRPSLSNWYRWYETYIIVFVILSICALWLLVSIWMIPAVN